MLAVAYGIAHDSTRYGVVQLLPGFVLPAKSLQAAGNGITRGRQAVAQNLLLGRLLRQHVQADHAIRARERAQMQPEPAALAGSAAVAQIARRIAFARRPQRLLQCGAVLLLQHAQEVLAHKLRRRRFVG